MEGLCTINTSSMQLCDINRVVLAFPIYITENIRQGLSSNTFFYYGICKRENVLKKMGRYLNDLPKIRFVCEINNGICSDTCNVLFNGVLISDLIFCRRCSKLMRGGSFSKHQKSMVHFLIDHSIILPVHRHICEIIIHLNKNHSFNEWDNIYKRINFPYLTSYKVKSFFNELCIEVGDIIKKEISLVKWITIFVDGWTKTRSYEGIFIGYMLNGRNVRRFLSLLYLADKPHTAKNLNEAIDELDKEFHFKEKILVLTSDSTNLMPCLARLNQWDHDPCINHKFSNVFNTFFKTLPSNICKAADSCNSLKANPQLFSHIKKFKKKSLKSFTPTRWLSVVNCLKSYVETYDVVSDWLKNKPNLSVEWNQDPDNLEILQRILCFLEKFVEISKLIETDKLESGKIGDFLCEGRKQINNMMADPTLLGFVPGWRDICNNFLKHYDDEFFNTSDPSCIRQITASFFFSEDDTIGFDDIDLLNEMMLYIYGISLDFVEMIHELDIIKNEEEAESEENKLSYIYLYQHQAKYPQLFGFAEHMARYPGSNANLERFFSRMTKVMPSWKSSYSADTFRTIAFLKGNIDLVQALLLGHEEVIQYFFPKGSFIYQTMVDTYRNGLTLNQYFDIYNPPPIIAGSSTIAQQNDDSAMSQELSESRMNIAIYQIYLHHIWWRNALKEDCLMLPTKFKLYPPKQQQTTKE